MPTKVYCDNDECKHCFSQSKDKLKWICKAKEIELDAQYDSTQMLCLTFEGKKD